MGQQTETIYGFIPCSLQSKTPLLAWLLLRFVLLLIFALNPQQDPSINLLVIVVGTGMLQMWAYCSLSHVITSGV